MSVKFEIPYFTVSGVTVRWTHLLLSDEVHASRYARYLKIIEKSGYQATYTFAYPTYTYALFVGPCR